MRSARSCSRASPRRPAIVWGLAVASVAFVGVVIGAPLRSPALVLVSVAVTGAACGLVFKGGVDLCTRIAPDQPTAGKLISSYYVACYLGGFSVPLLVVGILADLDRADRRTRRADGRGGRGVGLDLALVGVRCDRVGSRPQASRSTH